jgi:hypothetical protein
MEWLLGSDYLANCTHERGTLWAETPRGASVYSIEKLMAETRRLAADYRRATGKTLPVSGEIAVYDAIRILGLEAVTDNTVGHDAVDNRLTPPKRYQVKARVIFDENRTDHRIGQLKLEQAWDSVLLVLMNEDYEPEAIYAADRPAITEAMANTKDSNRAKRGAMSVARFKIIGRSVWVKEGQEDPTQQRRESAR